MELTDAMYAKLTLHEQSTYAHLTGEERAQFVRDRFALKPAEKPLAVVRDEAQRKARAAVRADIDRMFSTEQWERIPAAERLTFQCPDTKERSELAEKFKKWIRSGWGDSAA